jgi:hypothetical protein
MTDRRRRVCGRAPSGTDERRRPAAIIGPVWIALRLLLAVLGFVARQMSRRRKLGEPDEHRGRQYWEKIRRKKDRITGFAIGMARESPTWIRFHRENGFDRLCKRLRIAHEIETGSPEFDDRIYVTCDHPVVDKVLKEEPVLREAIGRAFSAGYRRVVFDGTIVWLERPSNVAPQRHDLDILFDIRAASDRLERNVASRLGDPFLWKAFAVEGVAWSILGFAIGAFVESEVHRQDYHLYPRQVMWAGLGTAAVSFALLLAAVLFSLRGSSRGHRVIAESALVLLLGVPVASIQMVSDTNRALDGDPPTVITRDANECEERRHRRRRGTYSTYHLHLMHQPDSGADGPELPSTIEITSSLCMRIELGMKVEFEIGPGRWGFPWYRRITAGGETQRPP